MTKWLLVIRICVARTRCVLCVSSYLFKLRCRLFSHTRIHREGATRPWRSSKCDMGRVATSFITWILGSSPRMTREWVPRPAMTRECTGPCAPVITVHHNKKSPKRASFLFTQTQFFNQFFVFIYAVLFDVCQQFLAAINHQQQTTA